MKHIEDKYKERISEIFSNGFEQELLNAAFINLNIDNPLRFNNFAYSLRELLRHLLHRLSPDVKVKACDWFKPEPTSSTGFTRKHRIKYAIQGGLSDFYITKKLGLEEIDDKIKELLDIITLLNSYTHIEPHTFNINETDVEKLAINCLDAMLGFVEKITETRDSVWEMLVDEIDKNLLERVISESVEEIMELSTHQFIEEIYSDGGHVETIGASSLLLHVTGNLDCELQYGSGSDLRNGNGVVVSQSFPFNSFINVLFKAPLGSVMEVDKINIDTSSFYE